MLSEIVTRLLHFGGRPWRQHDRVFVQALIHVRMQNEEALARW